MAALTTSIELTKISVSGNTTKNTTISWTPPVVPSGSTINSCTLAGHAVFAMSKGSVTTTINGTSIAHASDFTINLGTKTFHKIPYFDYIWYNWGKEFFM